ncbi:Secreted protein containing C-terminal beta-propeller domain [Halogranum amylolyticum]|uniref:Secreted protein containing C-terminal beta-propeller domain n=1 Tax=Halogranum amylolyticum TaxID=660520 RepID=A0A1H8TPB2_9EURY|nr:beta-propeller domain-containing protein [Halogranum amylolyticum]SEO92869.1 Secreted protein containing C-terminal beta-propeller domain [Halogranum amylolyticum]
MRRSPPLSTTAVAAIAMVALLVGTAVGAGVYAVAGPSDGLAVQAPSSGPGSSGSGAAATDETATTADVAAFESAAAFRDYLDAAAARGDGSHGTRFLNSPRATETVAVDDTATMTAAPTSTPQATAVEAESTAADGSAGGSGGSDVERVSGTNVQVTGIDEPDVVKTDGESVYYARGTRHGFHPGKRGGVTLLNTSEPVSPALAGEVDASGQLLLSGDTLVVLSHESVVAYDVSDRENPEERWSKQISGRLRTARLSDGQLYLVTVDGLDYDSPCPVQPFGERDVEIACTQVYHPTDPVPVDATYTTTALDPQSGDVADSVSFVGGHDSTVYMSGESLYVTYTEPPEYGRVHLDFLLSEQRDRLPNSVVDRLEQLREYDLSSRARSIETDRALGEWYRSLDDDERHEVRTELANEWREYLDDNKRELTTTGVVEVGVDTTGETPSLGVAGVGSVPGVPLNQFSLSEHDGNLRIATTIEARGTESENDLYVLDEQLDVVGEVQGMGLDEQIYSVRYVGDTAYVVTFKRIDPFHVVDLSDPENPELKGELKLPGFSSYLHPLSDDRVLGVGEEDGRVKAVVFDVSNPENPTVEDDYVLDERWSAIRESHHAFLMDRKHGVFFLPGRDGGYVFGYEDGLELKKVVGVERAQRAIYLNDYLYVFGQSEVVVVDETTWERVVTLELPAMEYRRDVVEPSSE